MEEEIVEIGANKFYRDRRILQKLLNNIRTLEIYEEFLKQGGGWHASESSNSMTNRSNYLDAKRFEETYKDLKKNIRVRLKRLEEKYEGTSLRPVETTLNKLENRVEILNPKKALKIYVFNAFHKVKFLKYFLSLPKGIQDAIYENIEEDEVLMGIIREPKYIIINYPIMKKFFYYFITIDRILEYIEEVTVNEEGRRILSRLRLVFVNNQELLLENVDNEDIEIEILSNIVLNLKDFVKIIYPQAKNFEFDFNIYRRISVVVGNYFGPEFDFGDLITNMKESSFYFPQVEELEEIEDIPKSHSSKEEGSKPREEKDKELEEKKRKIEEKDKELEEKDEELEEKYEGLKSSKPTQEELVRTQEELSSRVGSKTEPSKVKKQKNKIIKMFVTITFITITAILIVLYALYLKKKKEKKKSHKE